MIVIQWNDGSYSVLGKKRPLEKLLESEWIKELLPKIKAFYLGEWTNDGLKFVKKANLNTKEWETYYG